MSVVWLCILLDAYFTFKIKNGEYSGYTILFAAGAKLNFSDSYMYLSSMIYNRIFYGKNVNSVFTRELEEALSISNPDENAED